MGKIACYELPFQDAPTSFSLFQQAPIGWKETNLKECRLFRRDQSYQFWVCASNEIPGAHTTKFPRENQKCSPNSRIRKLRKFHWNWFGNYWTQGCLEYLQEKDVFFQSSHGRSPEGENLKNTLNAVDLKIKTGLQCKTPLQFKNVYLWLSICLFLHRKMVCCFIKQLFRISDLSLPIFSIISVYRITSYCILWW